MTNTTGKTPLMDIHFKEVEKHHQNEVKKLTEMELELVELISNTNNDELMDKFADWQGQRNVCNEGFNIVLKSMLK